MEINANECSSNLSSSQVPLRISESEGKFQIDFGPMPISPSPYVFRNVKYFHGGNMVKEVSEIKYDLIPSSLIPESSDISEETLWLPYDEMIWSIISKIDCAFLVEADGKLFMVLQVIKPVDFWESEQGRRFVKALNLRRPNTFHRLIK
jgi:hypothetical protein